MLNCKESRDYAQKMKSFMKEASKSGENFTKAMRKIFQDCDYAPSLMIKRHPALVAVINKNWLEKRLTILMSTDSSYISFKEFMKIVGQ